MRNPTDPNIFEDVKDGETLILQACLISAQYSDPAAAFTIAQHAVERMKQIFLDAVGVANART